MMWGAVIVTFSVIVACVICLFIKLNELENENMVLSDSKSALAKELKELKDICSPSVITVEQIHVPVEDVYAVLEIPRGVKLTDLEVHMKLATKLAEQMLIAGVVDIRSEYDFKTMEDHVKARVKVAKKVS